MKISPLMLERTQSFVLQQISFAEGTFSPSRKFAEVLHDQIIPTSKTLFYVGD